jgi:hypothetical protein
MQRIRIFTVGIAALGLAACAAGAVGPAANEPVPAGMAQIVVTRSSDLLYLGAPATVEVNGERFADLAVAETRSVAVRPGSALVTVSAWSAPGRYTLRFNAEADRRYRLHVTPRSEQMAAGMAAGFVGQAIEGGGPFRVAAEPAQIR